MKPKEIVNSLIKYLEDVVELSKSEDTHALEDFAMRYGGFDIDSMQNDPGGVFIEAIKNTITLIEKGIWL